MTLLEKDDKGFKVDLGYKRNFSDKFALAFSMKNIVSEFKSQDKLPQLFVVGLSQSVNKIGAPLTLYFDIFHDEDKKHGTYQGFVFDTQFFDLVGGVLYYYESEESDLSFGFNITYNKTTIQAQNSVYSFHFLCSIAKSVSGMVELMKHNRYI